MPVCVGATAAPVHHYIEYVNATGLLRCNRALQGIVQITGPGYSLAFVAVGFGNADMIDFRIIEADADEVTRFCSTAPKPCKRPAVSLVTQVVEYYDDEGDLVDTFIPGWGC